MKFLSFLEAAVRDVEKGLGFIVKEAPAVEGIAALIFPPSVAAFPEATLALQLVQDAILAAEQRYAATPGSGAQKAAGVITLTAPTVTHLLTKAGVPEVDTAYVQNLINLLVMLLKVKVAPAAVTVAATVAA